MSNLDAADALLLHIAPPGYILGQMPASYNACAVISYLATRGVRSSNSLPAVSA
jgi:hypothetical protein